MFSCCKFSSSHVWVLAAGSELVSSLGSLSFLCCSWSDRLNMQIQSHRFSSYSPCWTLYDFLCLYLQAYFLSFPSPFGGHHFCKTKLIPFPVSSLLLTLVLAVCFEGKGVATQSGIPAWRIPMDRGAWWATDHGVTKSLA